VHWLLVKDLQILRRSPLLVGMLIVYPVVIALMIGFALSSAPGKPRVAVYNAIPKGAGRINFGSSKIDVTSYATYLYQTIDPIIVHSERAAIAKVRDGEALAALIVPAGLPDEIQSLVRQGIGSPTVSLIVNTNDPIERQYVQQAIDSRLTQVEQLVSKQVLRVAVSDLQQVLNGGVINILGQNVHLLGLRNSKALIESAISALGRRSPVVASLTQVASFASIAIEGLAFASPVLGSIGAPLTVDQRALNGRTTPTDTYAVAIAVVVSLMFVTLLLAAGMLAIERSENTYHRLVRGLVSPSGLLAEKIVLSAGCAATVTLAMAMLVSLLVPLDWSRFELWIAGLALAGLAFGALGVGIGALAREVSTASLMAFLLSLPIAFVALVPGNAVSGGVKTLLDVVAFAFPFKPALEALDNAFSNSTPTIGLPLLHLVLLTAAFWGLGRLALRRFAS
jgi:ABC-type transport system involved in multi-copper enzyme maturation permease subunit